MSEGEPPVQAVAASQPNPEEHGAATSKPVLESAEALPHTVHRTLPAPSSGDFVILWAGYSSISSVVLEDGGITNNRLGSFGHDDMIGVPYGSRIYARRGDMWLVMLRPSPELITQSLTHRTQIIYHADIALVISLLDVRPGKIIIEAGTGSGSLSTSLARALRPGGQLNTFEFHEERQRQAAADFKRYGIDDIVISRHGDAIIDGFGAELRNKAHGVFLDLPAPWSALPHADECLVDGGRICTFSPCMEQIERTAAEMRRLNYLDIRMFESLAMPWGVRAGSEAADKNQTAKKRRVDNKGKAGKKGKGKGKGKGKAKDDDNAGEDDLVCEGDLVSRDVCEGSAKSWASFPLPMRGHTSYLMVATKPPAEELLAPI